jgi:mannitol/fructose-specific phosphotransferase system IIA component (Ntr-type)
LPVHLVFLLLTPARDEGLQLQILAALARTLHGQALRDRLALAENGRQVWLILEQALGAQQTGHQVGQ